MTICTSISIGADATGHRRLGAVAAMLACCWLGSPLAGAKTIELTLPLPAKSASNAPAAVVTGVAPVEIRDPLNGAQGSVAQQPAAADATSETATTLQPASTRNSETARTQQAVAEQSVSVVNKPTLKAHSLTVSKGTSLYRLFSSHGFSHGELMDILSADPAIKRRLTRVQPGDVITLYTDQDRRIHQLVASSRHTTNLNVVRGQDGFSIQLPQSTQASVTTTSDTSNDVTRSVSASTTIEAASPVETVRTALALRKGQSLYELFQEHKLSRIDLLAMTRSSASTKRRLSRLRPGQKLDVEHIAGDIVSLRLLGRRGGRDYLITRSNDAYLAQDVAAAPAEAPAVASTSPSSPSTNDDAIAQTQAEPANIDVASEQDAGNPPTLPAAVVEHELAVQRGDSLYSVFSRLGVPGNELARIMANDGAKPLRKLRPGQVLSLRLLSDQRVLSLSSEVDETRTLEILRQPDDSMRVRVRETPLERRTASASGVIEDSLFLSGQRAGLSDRVIMHLVQVFAWDVDFALDVRVGDRFTIIFEELYKDGVKVRDGNILAAEFVNGGRSLRGIRYTDKTGATAFFSPDGLSMRKAFLRTPVNFSRISSRFSTARRHPVLNKIRAHRGVDYAAPRGTPIMASGNGRVKFSGWRRGYGRTVQIQHGSKYSTLYAHMSRIHRRAAEGRRVRQGEVIGYVGSTGLATGPHLHYEFRVNGVHKDPLRVKLPKALPIEDRYRQDFLNTARPLMAQLDLLVKTSLASSD